MHMYVKVVHWKFLSICLSYVRTNWFCLHYRTLQCLLLNNQQLASYVWYSSTQTWRSFWITHECSHFYLSHSSMLACYSLVVLVVLRIWLTSDRICMTIARAIHESPYESPYEFLRGNGNAGVDTWNMWFTNKQLH